MNVNSNNQEQRYKKPTAGQVIAGCLAGSTVKNVVALPHQIISPKIMHKMVAISNSLKPDEFAKVGEAIEQSISSSGLKEKGIQIVKAGLENETEIVEIMGREYNKGIFKFMPKAIKSFLADNGSAAVINGKNAFYAPASKKVVIPQKGLELATFHEIGHALNANMSKFGKILQKSRGLQLLSIPIALIALFKTKKAEGEEPKNGLDKATTFVKNNAGKLTFATFIPMLAEEGLATIKGNNIAKKLLSPELAKKVAKSNALGFSTYLMLATLSSLGIYLGVKVKDAIAHKKSVEQQKA